MESDIRSGKIPATLQRELRSTLASLGIKMTISAEELKRETDPTRVQDLRDQIASLKAEAKVLVDKYKWAKTLYEQEIEAVIGGDSESAATIDEDGLLVFDLAEPAAEPAAAPSAAAALDDFELVLDLDPDLTPTPSGSASLDTLGDPGGLVLDQVELSLGVPEPQMAAMRAARGGRLGEAFGLAVEASARRSAEWGGPLLASLLSTALLAIERGADEDETIAALLHPALTEANEDQILKEIRADFGERVVTLVAWSAWMLRIDPWEQRDRAYLKRMQEAPPAAVLASLCARLVASRAMTARRKAAGTGALDQPGRGRDRLVWSLRALVKAYRSVADPLVVGPLLDEWEAAVATVERATGATGPV